MLLGEMPEVGSPYVKRHGLMVRRILLARTHHHVYYEVDRESGVVMILAIWGVWLGRSPRL
jgi:plasmid stabilization system protein ParE